MFRGSNLRKILAEQQREFHKDKFFIQRNNLKVHNSNNKCINNSIVDNYNITNKSKNKSKNNNNICAEFMARQRNDEVAEGQLVATVGATGSFERTATNPSKNTTAAIAQIPTHYFTSQEDEQLKVTKTDDSNSNNNNSNEREKEQEQQDNALDYRNMDIFHRAVRPILILGQCFALMPVVGVQHPNPRHVRFSFKSLQMGVTLAFIGASLVLFLSMLRLLIHIGVNAKNFVGLAFFGSVQCACLLFLSLAPKWPHLIRLWTRTELLFIRTPYAIPKRNLATRVRTAAIVIIFLSILEHAFFQLSAVHTYRSKQLICAQRQNITALLSFEDYITKQYDYIFSLLPYSRFIGVYALIISGACTFVWNYMDLFIMMISKGIAYRFEQITARIKSFSDKDVPEATFVEIREHYVKMCELLEYIDDNLAGLILLSCLNNLYFVCYQLLNIFNKLRWPINYIYFWYSLLYLVGRTAFVFLTAASINDESKGALGVLRRVSSRTWCVEVERLIFQMTTQTIALSGKKFYFLTRSLLFGMAGTIVTYELVLLQFDEPNRTKGLPELCN